ncbi:band 4.1-like protein 2 isoform X5 [Ambystoma mexicanum]|uniref:band 4.1-like protein 2 isoform X5 n=1 Tax=Ambystoma mexicanum TaxID=8296 RepID=UPI0037E8D3CA
MTTEAGPVPEVKDSPKKKAEQLGQPQTSEELQQMGVETINENGSEDMEHTGDAKPEADAMPSPTSPAPSSPTSPGSQKKEKRSPDGKGISRFMPPWLRKQKSQSHVDPKDVDEMKPLQDIEENKAIVLEVEVLETDKELRKSSESQPKIDDVEEKKSVSSAGTQPAKEEGLETGREIQVVAEEKTEKEEDEETKKDAKENSVKSKTEKVSEKLPKKLKTVLCKVIFLDKTEYSYEIEKRAKGQVLFDKVCEQLNLLEKDYFGLTFQDHANQKNWVDPAKGIKRQIRSMPWLFGFNVKFYPPDPSQLTEDLTRYFLCLQLRQDVASGRLPCSFVTHSLLGSYTLQAELGDYDPEEHNVDYISEFQFAPNQNKELEEKVVDLHKSHRGLTPSQADLQFVENAKKLSMYGVDLHRAKDSEAVDIMLGISASGLFIYKDRLRINRFAWPKILKISYKRNNFYIKVRPAEQDQFESTIGFKLPNHRAAKRLWKVCVEHHAFFRLKSPDKTPKAKFLTLGSKFRYSGRTQAQTQEASTLIDRPAPYFERTSSKRISRSLDGAPMVCITDTNLSNDIAATSNSVDGDFPGIHVVEDGTSTEASKGQAKVEKDQSGFSNAAVDLQETAKAEKEEEEEEDSQQQKDLDKTQDELLKHQASISELKRSFMESSPEPRPNEWEKRRIAPLSVQAQGSSDDIQNIVDNHMEFMTKETIVNEEVTKELNGDLQNHAEDTGRTLNLKVLVKKDSASFSSSESSSEDEDDGAEYQPDNRVAQEVIEELEEQVEDVEEHFPAGGVHSIETIDAGPITLKNIHAKGMLEPLLHETIVTPCIENNQELPEGISQEVREEAEEHPGVNGDDSHFEVEISPQIIFCSEPPVVKTEMVTISDASQKMEICTKEVPLVQTESKTITFESSQVDGSGDSEPGVLMSAQTITSESVSTTTTTHITKTIKGGVSETRIEKRIVITGDADIDHDEALAQAIKEAKELHPDMSVTRVVVHKETEVTDEGDEVYP